MQTRRSILAAAVGIVATGHLAQAIELNPDGMGQVLIYPYYTVNANNTTLLSVVNTTAKAKAVKVRFLEGYNGQEVLDFNLFLSKFDVWTAGIFALTETGSANLLTDDESCTIPDIKGASGPAIGHLPEPDGRSYVPLRAQGLHDGGPTSLPRTREGHIELMEMATLSSGSTLEEAVTHIDGVPPGCTDLLTTVNAHLTDFGRPTGGLFGSANIVNPALGTLIGYNADAVDGFYQLSGNLYSDSFLATPTLADARTTATTVVAHNYAPSAEDGPNNLITSTYTSANAIDAVSSLFTANTLTNEYVVEAASASESEWVINFPTKRYYVNTAPAIAPFVRSFAAPGQSCTLVGIRFSDREERESRDPFDCGFICPAAPPIQLCYETNVMTFQRGADYTASGGVSAVLGSKLTMNVDPRAEGYNSGWLRLDLSPSTGQPEPHALRPSTDQDVFVGLPATGFLATNYLNRNNGGPNVLSTYSTSGRHRASRTCVNVTVDGSGFCS